MPSFVTQTDIQMSGPGILGSDVAGDAPRKSKRISLGAGFSLVDGVLTVTTDLSGYLPLAGGTLTGDLKFTDATYDIGKSGATRPRDGFFSRNLTTGGFITTDYVLSDYGNYTNPVFQIGGASQGFGADSITVFARTSSTTVWIANTAVFNLGTAQAFGWTASGSASASAADLTLLRDAANTLAQRNGTNAQSFRVYTTYTSGSSLELLQMRGVASSSFEIGTMNGSAGGTLRGLTIGCYPAGTSTIVGWTQFRPNTSTGALEAFYLGPIADSTATGGNTRGIGAADLQMIRSAANQVASGDGSFLSGRRGRAAGAGSFCFGDDSAALGQFAVAIGCFCNATAYGSTAIGINALASNSQSLALSNGGVGCTASGADSFAMGDGALADRTDLFAYANGRFATNGDAQEIGLILRNKTTDATPVNLFSNGSTTRLTIPSGKTMSGFLIVKGVKSDGSAKARFVRLCDITNVGGTTSLDTPVEAIGTDYNPSGCVLAVTAENATDDLQVNITGPAGETWRWTATFSGLEIAYGT